MIDIHHHCLPGVDDGPRELAEAVELCRMAADEGIETIVATPHVLRGRWQNTSRAKLQGALEQLRAQLGGKPNVVLGSEYFFAHDVAEVLRTGGAIVPLAGSRYVLVEFAAHAIPPMVEQPFYHLQLDGWTPIIAHPERNLVFQHKPDLLVSLIRLGARTQVTFGSLTGHFGPEAERAASDWLERGYVHFLATDAHNTTKRPPRAADGLKRATELVGVAVAQALTRSNPAAVVAGRPLVYEPELPYPTHSPGFFDRLSRLFVHREKR